MTLCYNPELCFLRWYALSPKGKLSELLALYALPDGRWVL